MTIRKFVKLLEKQGFNMDFIAFRNTDPDFKDFEDNEIVFVGKNEKEIYHIKVTQISSDTNKINSIGGFDENGFWRH